MTELTDQNLEDLSLAIQNGAVGLCEAALQLQECSVDISRASMEVVGYHKRLCTEVTMYRLHLYPRTIRLVERIKDMLENYTLISFEDFGEDLDEIRQKCQECAVLAGKLQIEHSFVLSNLSRLGKEMSNAENELAEKALQIHTKAEKHQKTGKVWKTVGAVGIVAAPFDCGLTATIGTSIGRAYCSAAKRGFRNEDDLCRSIATLEHLSQSLIHASTAINVIGQFMGLMRSDLDGVARAGSSSTFSKIHWRKMTAKAKGVIQSCNSFIAQKSIIEAHFLTMNQHFAIPAGYEEQWRKDLVTHTMTEG